MTDPDLAGVLLQCFVFFAFLAFVIAHLLLGGKRVYEWFQRRQENRQPQSVYNTLNLMSFDEEAAYRVSRHATIEQGGRNAKP